ncbi:MAG TPA: C40 family peptidase [Gaiellaceae bacterium]|nr:C40 family peptidase [Gaiellaceae bacterium]
MKRLVLTGAVLALVLAAPAAAAGSWAQPQIKLVTARGLMGGSAAAFRPDDALTAGDLNGLVAGLTGRPAAAAAASSGVPVTIAQLDAQLVRALGLLPTARQLTASLRAAGLVPTSYFGTETVARLLGLRVNHPTALDSLELGPENVATRAEAAYSAARILSFPAGEADAIARLAATFRPPPLGGFQRAVLQTAVSLVGYPYVWGGTSELPQNPFGQPTQVPGGFDCSGFAWRVYKLQGYPGAGALPGVLRGRTTYAMAAEVPPAKRIPLMKVVPGDLLFFGSAGPRSKPAQIDHMGIYLGAGWFVQSSEQGVALAPLTPDWYGKRFAWARRPLAEAGLL